MSTTSKWKDSIVYFIVLVFSWFCQVLPKKLTMILATGIGKLLYLTLKKRREIAQKNLQLAFGNDLSDEERTEICKASFVNFSKTIIEFLRFTKLNAENIWNEVSVEGSEHIHAALAEEKGVIVFLPHFGNWELLSLVYGVLIPNRGTAIAFPLKNEKLNAFIWKRRELLSLKIIPKQHAVRATLRALKEKKAVGFFADQNAGEQGVFVDFFGKLASTAKGPVTLALKTGAPIVFSLDIRLPNDKHRVYISPPIRLETSDNIEQDIEKWTRKLMEMLEGYIKEYPDQWLWLHNRWKTRPKKE